MSSEALKEKTREELLADENEQLRGDNQLLREENEALKNVIIGLGGSIPAVLTPEAKPNQETHLTGTAQAFLRVVHAHPEIGVDTSEGRARILQIMRHPKTGDSGRGPDSEEDVPAKS